MILDYEIELKGSSSYTGSVHLKFRGVSGGICSDNWDDSDARVVCKEMGYQDGQAYRHYRKIGSYSTKFDGPFWTSNVNCR